MSIYMKKNYFPVKLLRSGLEANANSEIEFPQVISYHFSKVRDCCLSPLSWWL